ncbi:hypothetical protein NPIL_222781 [Nephila pilipes]|uniref:Uncharacterized protein n=1 Tax=Nephila pilipes TaxID=299642 RepID=A0A8X6PY39_NEPPI|nr:hypothetical protein NPIL_222781 [Nephila pilipes]
MNGVRSRFPKHSYWQDEDQIDVVDADDQLLTHTPPDGDIALSLLIDGKLNSSFSCSEYTFDFQPFVAETETIESNAENI